MFWLYCKVVLYILGVSAYLVNLVMGKVQLIFELRI